MLDIGEANPDNPFRVLIYSGPGIGKSTFGALSEDPIFITPEGGVDQLKDRHGKKSKFLRGMNSWDVIRAGVISLINDKHEFKTLVLDSADWIEKTCHTKIIGASGKDIIRCNGGYGSGYREAEKLHIDLINDLTILREKRGMNIIVTAHEQVKEVKDPAALQPYDRFEIKCHQFVSSLWREFVDALLFARFRTFVKGEGDAKAKAFTDGTRVVYTQETPAFQAKNRYGLPPEMDFTKGFWQEFMNHARKGIVQESREELISEITELYKLMPPEILEKIQESVDKTGGDPSKLIPIRKRMKELAKK